MEEQKDIPLQDFTVAEAHTLASQGKVIPRKATNEAIVIPPVNVGGHFPGEVHRQLARKIRKVTRPRANGVALDEGNKTLLVYFLRFFGNADMDAEAAEKALQ